MKKQKNRKITLSNKQRRTKARWTTRRTFCVLKKRCRVAEQKKISKNEWGREKAPSGCRTTRRRVVLVEIINVLWAVCTVFIEKYARVNSNWIRKLTHEKVAQFPHLYISLTHSPQYACNLFFLTLKTGVKNQQEASRRSFCDLNNWKGTTKKKSKTRRKWFAAPPNDAIVKTQTEFIIRCLLMLPRKFIAGTCKALRVRNFLSFKKSATSCEKPVKHK